MKKTDREVFRWRTKIAKRAKKLGDIGTEAEAMITKAGLPRGQSSRIDTTIHRQGLKQNERNTESMTQTSGIRPPAIRMWPTRSQLPDVDLEKLCFNSLNVI